jgi:ribosomal protein S13
VCNKDSLVRAHNRIDKLEEAQNSKIKELSENLKTVSDNQIRMEEKINLLVKNRSN